MVQIKVNFINDFNILYGYLDWHIHCNEEEGTSLIERSGNMNCPRCSGMMFSERLSDFFLTFFAWKCVNCGSIVDRTILLNKKKSSLFTTEFPSHSHNGPKS